MSQRKTIVYNARLKNKDGLSFVEIIGGNIAKIASMEAYVEEEGTIQLNAEGGLILPPFVDSHIHYDSAFTAGEPRYNESGTLQEAIQCLQARRRLATYDDYKQRAMKVIEWQTAQGVQHVRVHTDVSGPDLTGLEVMLALKNDMKPWVNLQIVAFPQLGITETSRLKELLVEAIELGADGVGGMPQQEMTEELGRQSIQVIFDLAEKHNKFVDIHCDETDDDQSRFIEVVAAEAFKRQYGVRTTASHVTAMHSYNNAYAAKVIELIAKSGIHIVANPLSNISLQGRYDSYPVRRGITRIKPLIEAGVNVSLGHDNFIDPFYSLGTGGMLPVLNMGIHACHALSYQEIQQSMDWITYNGANTLQLPSEEYGLERGKVANFIVVDAPDVVECIRKQAAIRYSLRNGKLISRNLPRKLQVMSPETMKLESIELNRT